MSVHLVLYSNNLPFDKTKKLIIESIRNFTKRNIIIHDYNLEEIKKRDWFNLIKDLPSIKKGGRRDGYYNSWKGFICQEVYKKMNENDILYYTDCSQYFIEGFKHNIDKVCNVVEEKLFIAGSMADDVKNNSFGCCDNINVWNEIIKSNDNSKYLNKRHVLNSWFLLKKCSANDIFIDEWAKFTVHKYNNYPLVTYHHTGDQSIFNILVYKYKKFVFYSKDIGHNTNKNKNLMLEILNNNTMIDNFFIIAT